MLKLLKYIPLVALGKDITNALKQKGTDRPAYLTRRFVGAAIIFIGAFLSIQFGVTIEENIIQQMIDDTDKLIAMAIAGYGAVLGIYGTVRAIVKKIKEKKQ